MSMSGMSGMGGMGGGMNSSGMGGMNMSSMSSMSMVFTTDHSTPLFSAQWTPTSNGAYAGTCIFLVILAIISRMLQSYRQILELKWHDKAVKRKYIILTDDTAEQSEKTTGLRSGAEQEATLTVRGVDERVRVLRRSTRGLETQPWRFSTDLPRACVFVVQAGVGYLLMLAVMALNVGYFLSVLVGLFVGELLLGRYIMMDDGHH